MQNKEILDNYLSELKQALQSVDADAPRTLREAEDHIRERIDLLESEGRDSASAAKIAVEEFGKPADIARAFSETRISPIFKNPLHVRCGDDIIGSLKAAGIPGRMLKWCDPLSVGPTPGGLSQEEWYQVRGKFLSDSFQMSLEDAIADLRRQDSGLEDLEQHDVVLLWFEHDLFDQIILVWLLQHFAQIEMKGTELRLICVDEFPGVENFIGLGQLEPQELVALYGTSEKVTDAQLSLAKDVWAGWCSLDPSGLEKLLSSDTSALPFVRNAVRRHLQNFPSTTNGLSLTEQLALEAIAEGAIKAGNIFLSVQSNEENPWMGDSMLFAALERLRQGTVPLVESSRDEIIDLKVEVKLTAAGHRVLTGESDFIALNGIDNWVGGVHLTSNNVWRWDPLDQRVVRQRQ